MSSNQVQNRMDLVRTAYGREPFELIIQNIYIVIVHSEEINKGNIGIGFIRGFGIQRGAISSTVAHDHHNQIIAGVDDESMATCAVPRKPSKAGSWLSLGIRCWRSFPCKLVV